MPIRKKAGTSGSRKAARGGASQSRPGAPRNAASGVSRTAAAMPGGAALDLERRFSYRFAIISARVVRSVAGMYGPKYRMLPSGWKALAVIGRYGPLSAKDVGAYSTVEPDKVTRAVDRLVKLGFVARRKDLGDRRKVVLSLTATGRRVYDDVEQLTRQVEMATLSALPARDLAALGRVLDRLEERSRTLLTGRDAWQRIRKQG